MARVVILGGEKTAARLRDHLLRGASEVRICSSAVAVRQMLKTGAFEIAVLDLSLFDLERPRDARLSSATRSSKGEQVELLDSERLLVVDGARRRLRNIECRILRCVMNGLGQVVTWETIERKVWAPENAGAVEAAAVRPGVTSRDSHVCHLRAKLGSAAWRLETVRGVGLRWLEPDGADDDAAPARRG